MAEHILGMGHKKSVREVIAATEHELSRMEGYPRRIVGRTSVLEVEAEREEFSGTFDRFLLRIHPGCQTNQKVEQVTANYPDASRLTVESGWHIVACPGDTQPVNKERVLEAVDKISECLALPEIWRMRGEDYRIDPISTELLFQAMVKYRASDVHLCPGMPPVFRVDNENHTSELLGALSSPQILALVKEICSDKEWSEFEEHKQVSFNFHQVGIGYSRVSAFYKAGAPHCTFRFLPEVIPSFEDLNIPGDSLRELANMHHGLLLVTGMTGSGKTTTVAAIVDWINSNRSLHILTIENPIEYVHRNKRSMISQRNTGKDVLTFGEAVTGALRHDPDVIVIGEMRDPDTIRSAINAAATGHLVISTLHSNTASEVINRIISFFDPVERDLVRLQLRDCLRCVICQRLVPRIGGGRVPALEFLFNDIKAINDSILSGDTEGIRIGMQQTVSHSFLFEHYLHKLYKKGTVDLEHARAYCTEVTVLDQLVMGTYSVPRLDTIKAAHDGKLLR